jgi:methylated-DNA-[protein]-cysteine S-methyltransferase
MNSSVNKIFKGFLQSPIGLLEITSDGDSITSILFREKEHLGQEANTNHVILFCIDQLNEYFDGNRQIFELPTNPSGTEFQNKVWERVCKIPFGETTSYGNIATALGDPKLNRAVGSANGANPIPIIIPCHRVIGNDGSLTGYGGGLNKKRWLLNHEQQNYTSVKGQLKLF